MTSSERALCANITRRLDVLPCNGDAWECGSMAKQGTNFFGHLDKWYRLG